MNPILGSGLVFTKKYGDEGLLPRKKQQYDIDFKLKVLSAIKKKSLFLREACVKFNIRSEANIIKWQKAFEREGSAGLVTKPKGRPTMNFKRSKKKSDNPLT